MIIIAPSKKKFNEYEIRGNVTVIFLERKNGEKLETLIDTEDLERIKDLGYHWHTRYDKITKSYYARTTTEYYINKNNNISEGSLYLNVVIMNGNYIENQYVHHKTHDTLDNRKINLEIIPMENNAKHRKGKNINNTSGYRNVSWNKNDNCWMVQLQVNRKNTRLKNFPEDKLDEAGQYAKEMRDKYYGEYSGINT